VSACAIYKWGWEPRGVLFVVAFLSSLYTVPCPHFSLSRILTSFLRL
jgi:hypothetical protein